MRSLEHARESWQALQQCQSLRELKDAVRLQSQSSLATAGLRSACWKAFLLFDTLDVTEWLRTLAASRSAYNSLRTHFFRYIEDPAAIEAQSDPLGQDAESSPWSHMHNDEALRAEILQDVERIGVPDVEYFQQRERQQMLLDVLFVFCKLNPDVGYRQGMHEIAGLILYVLESEAVDVGGISKTLGEDSTIKAVFDAEHIEHDTFALFGQVMQSAKTFYLSEGPVSIATRSRHIFDELLPQIDPDLVKHLKALDIVPQVFLIRWIRLLFGREFDFHSALALWDVIFAEDSSLELVDHICLAMLLRIRWHLLDADYNNALSLLLRYPELEKDFPAQTFGFDAMYLRKHMTPEGGSYLVLKYTGRPLVVGRPSTPPALQRNITTFAIRHASPTGRKGSTASTQQYRQSTNIEAMLQNTAKNIYARGEKLGIGKVVRTAVDEVHKKAQEIREAQTPSPASWRRSGNVRVLDHVKHLERRNKRLSDLLSGAVNELWEYQRLIIEQRPNDGEAQQSDTVEKLSTAIAKVQFVQVYLDEPTLSLPNDDDIPSNEPVEDVQQSKHSAADRGSPEKSEFQIHSPSPIQPFPDAAQSTGSTADKLADPSTFEGFATPNNNSPTPKARGERNATGEVASTADDTATEKNSIAAKTQRPPLEQSAFSFMLGQDPQSDPATDTRPSRARQHRPDGSLFGGHRRNFSGSGKTTTPATSDVPGGQGDEDDEFDISSLRRAKGTLG